MREQSEITWGTGESGEYLLNPEKVLNFLPERIPRMSWKSQLLCHVVGSPWQQLSPHRHSLTPLPQCGMGNIRELRGQK